MFYRKVTILLTLFTLLLLFVVWINSTSSSEKREEELRIGYSALRISLPIFVAQEKGFFEQQGLAVALERFDTAQPLMQSLVSGQIDLAGYTALPITFNAMLRSREELYFSTAMIEDQSHRISSLIVPYDTPETFRIEDLKGKRIGILPTVAYKAWIEEILRQHDIDSEEVTLIQINPALSPTALASGQVDALFTNDPAATTVIAQKIGRLLDPMVVEVPKFLGEPFLFGSFNLRKDFVDEQPIIAEKVVQALNDAIAFIHAYPEEAKLMMKPYVHASQEDFVALYPNARYLNSAELNETDLGQIAEQYLDIGIISESLLLENVVFPRL